MQALKLYIAAILTAAFAWCSTPAYAAESPDTVLVVAGGFVAPNGEMIASEFHIGFESMEECKAASLLRFVSNTPFEDVTGGSICVPFAEYQSRISGAPVRGI